MPELRCALDVGAFRNTRFVPVPGKGAKDQDAGEDWKMTRQATPSEYLLSCPSNMESCQEKSSSPPQLSGIMKYIKKLEPTHNELEARVAKDWSKLKKGYRKSQIKTTAVKYLQEIKQEEKRVEELLKDWSQGGYRHFILKKAEGIFRLLWEKFNSLSILTDKWDLCTVRKLEVLRKNLNADMLSGCETQTNWYKVPNDKQFDRLVGIGEC